MSTIGKDRLVLDTAELADSDNVGAFLRDATGALLTSTPVGAIQALDVAPTDTYVEDSAHASGDIGGFILGVRNDASSALTSADGDYSPIAVDSAGRVKVVGTFTTGDNHAEDAAHVTGDTGSFSLAVRQDAISSLVSADGDYGAFKIDAVGAMYANVIGSNVADDVADAHNPVKIGSKAVSGALAAVSATGDRANAISDLYRRIFVNDSPNIDVASVTVAVDNTVGGVALPAAALAGRRRVLIQNISSRPVYVGKLGTVDTANGLRISGSGTLALEVGEDVDLAAIIAVAGPSDVRVLELA